MPSKGRQVVPVRFSPELLALVDETIASRNRHSPGEPWDRSEFIRQAVRDKISHARRSRAPKRL
jgi:metal-responsive CopG/Arc/MetJ family transcriptional regulator